MGWVVRREQVPYVAMQGFVAFMGSLTVPIVFGIMRESGYPIVVAAFSACLVLFGEFFPSPPLRLAPYIEEVDHELILTLFLNGDMGCVL